MKKSFFDAFSRIKGLFSKADNIDNVNSKENASPSGEGNSRSSSGLFVRLKRAVKKVSYFLSRYRFAVSCSVIMLILAAVSVICISAGSNSISIANTAYNDETIPSASLRPAATNTPATLEALEETPQASQELDLYPESEYTANFTVLPTQNGQDLYSEGGIVVKRSLCFTTPEPDLVLHREHNDIILEVQSRLMDLWYMDKDEPTDYFGNITEGALKVFQRRNDLEVTGRLTRETYDLLMSVDARVYMTVLGDSGDDVIVVQSRLYELGYLESYYNTKGTFDESTEIAVKEFQAANNLSVDGKVGKNTKEALYSPDAKGKGFEIGDQDPAIKTYQERLKELGYLTTEPDGIFGKDTQIAVKRFQVQNDLIEDGFLGPVTRAKLMSSDAVGNALHFGMEGSDVRNIQQRLYELNYLRAKNVNGYFTSITEKAVKLFQKNCGIQQDGKVGRNTMNRLFSDDAPRASSPVDDGSGSGSGGGTGGGTGGGQSDVDKLIENFIRIANNKLGSRYVRGGKGPNVFDCSGFVYWCLNKAGVHQSYMTSYMWRSCTRYQRNNYFNKIKRGDVIVYDGHVAIALGNGMMIDASQSKGQVVIRSYQSSYWRSVFICSYRIFR